jgi:hypothetical protein
MPVDKGLSTNAAVESSPPTERGGASRRPGKGGGGKRRRGLPKADPRQAERQLTQKTRDDEQLAAGTYYHTIDLLWGKASEVAKEACYKELRPAQHTIPCLRWTATQQFTLYEPYEATEAVTAEGTTTAIMIRY